MSEQSRIYNEDLAPVPLERRTWNMWHYAALWVGLACCIPSYMLAASLMQSGMYWWQALFTISLANVIVLVPMILNGHPGTKYGIPFPVLLRSSFGVRGVNIPALMRALVACGWFGIQTWIGGAAIHSLLLAMFGELPDTAALPVLGITLVQLACFLVFWAINMAVIVRGIECIKWLEKWSAPFLITVSLALLYWGVSNAGGISRVFADETVAQVRKNVPDFEFWKSFFPLLTGMVGFWATLALNISDFTRYSRSQKDQIVGQAISLPPTMTLFSFIGIAVTASTVVIFGETIWDPVILIGRFESPLAVCFALVALLIATLTTNIAANVVSPANDISNLAPTKISFKMGGIITGIVGVVIMPWKLVVDLGAYIFTWLIGYGALLGAIAGVMLCDYYLIRRTQLDVDELFRIDGKYSFGGSGYNWRALTALAIGIAPNIPGFLAAASNGAVKVPPFFTTLYTYAWFVGVFAAGAAHLALTLAFPCEEEATPDIEPVEIAEAG